GFATSLPLQPGTLLLRALTVIPCSLQIPSEDLRLQDSQIISGGSYETGNVAVFRSVTHSYRDASGLRPDESDRNLDGYCRGHEQRGHSQCGRGCSRDHDRDKIPHDVRL